MDIFESIRSWSGPNRFHIYVHIQTAFHPAIHTKQNPIFFISPLKSLDILYDTSYLYQRASCLNYKSSLIVDGLRGSFRGQIWFWFCKMYLLRDWCTKKGKSTPTWQDFWEGNWDDTSEDSQNALVRSRYLPNNILYYISYFHGSYLLS